VPAPQVRAGRAEPKAKNLVFAQEDSNFQERDPSLLRMTCAKINLTMY
jgi:hypothetical protein